MKREFFLQDDKSNKFWSIEQAGCTYTTRHGRVGSKPRETIKSFDSESEAHQQAEKQIAAKLKKGYVEGKPPAYEKPDWAAMSMDEAVFWRIIRLFNWKRTGDDEAVIEPAVAALASMPIEAINRFEDLLTEKLYALDTLDHARQIGSDAYKEGKHFSVDLFLYARCVVIANGKEVFDEVIADPSEMPRDLEFEALLEVASTAYERKTDEPFDYSHPSLSYETYSNKQGWA